MISPFNGGNTCQPPEPVLSPDEWEARLEHDEWEAARAVDASIALTPAVTGARLIVRCGTNPVIAAAAVQRAWFADRRAAGVTIPGSPDEFVAAVRGVIAEARGVPNSV